ncbi:MAG: protein kinase [Candidatus Latescibacterota bacterium]|nr:MAG: protein kinase [Candidatus Latescibacterota bacterium]
MIGQTISHYKILEKLGGGGMGVVYKAEDTKLKRTVALKFLPPELTRDKDTKTRFVQEAQTASSLEHQNICNIHEIDETPDGRMFIAMACYQGETVRQKLSKKPLGLTEAVDIAMQVARGLAKAHEQGIMHRDIKPANIFVTEDEQAKILDFGLAKLAGEKGVTKTGTTVGTAAYLSPEQALGQKIDHRTDIWSLGVTLYEMIAGKRPFDAEHEQALFYSIVNQDPEPLTGLRTRVPMELERIVMKAMAKDPGDRYQHADDLLVDLRSVHSDLESGTISKLTPKKRRSRKRRILLFVSIPVALAIIVVGRYYVFPPGAGAIDSIAVLPLENLSGDPEKDYVSDGMTEALIANLAKIRALKVISRTSVMRYKRTDKSLPQIAKELNVDAVVEGSVILVGNQVRITAQLIEAATDRHLWAEEYARDFRDVLSLQSEVARAIAREVRIELTRDEQVQLTRVREVPPEAQDAYMKGRYHWNKRTEEAIRRSAEYFESAIEIDPDFAAAYAGLADAYMTMGSWGFLKIQEAYPKSMRFARKALEIDDDLAEAHATLALLRYTYSLDWRGAESGFKRAIEIQPSYATARQWYAQYLLFSLRFDDALEEINRALEFDPLKPIINSTRALILYYSGHIEEALEQIQTTLEIKADFFAAHYQFQLIYAGERMHGEALDGLERIFLYRGADADDIALMRETFDTSGIEGVYRWSLGMWTKLSDRGYVDPYNFAANHAALEEKDEAFEWLEKAYREGSYLSIILIRVDPRFECLRSDPRYPSLLRRIGVES